MATPTGVLATACLRSFVGFLFLHSGWHRHCLSLSLQRDWCLVVVCACVRLLEYGTLGRRSTPDKQGRCCPTCSRFLSTGFMRRFWRVMTQQQYYVNRVLYARAPQKTDVGSYVVYTASQKHTTQWYSIEPRRQRLVVIDPRYADLVAVSSPYK